MRRDKEEKMGKKRKRKKNIKKKSSFIYFEFQYTDHQLIQATETIMNNKDQNQIAIKERELK